MTARPARASCRAPGGAGDRVATIVLGDGHVVFLDALSTVLTQQGHVVCGVAHSPAELVTLVRVHRPEACLIDHNNRADGAAQSIGQVLAACDSTSVIVLGADQGGDAAGRALGAGASGYVHQSRGVSALVSVLDRVLGGEIVVDVPDVSPPRRPAEPSQALRLAAQLTSRERECLMMLVEGLDTAAMVHLLGVSRTTVRTHLQSVLTKLGVHSRLEAASFAVRHRLPDIWSGENLLASVGAARYSAARGDSIRPAGAAPETLPAPRIAQTASMRRAARPGQPGSTVRPIRSRRAQGARKRAVSAPPLPVAAGQGVSAG
jgi:two-component system, NarL family, nitrate/nitrite response regulator NarL